MLLALLRFGARVQIIVAALAMCLLLTKTDAERYGDALQIALPVSALGCAGSTHNGTEFFLRYAAMFFVAHSTKRALEGQALNQRPNGGRHGFPSAHTSTAVLGASRLVHDCLRAHPVGQAVVLLAAGFVGGSRIEAGAHDIWQVLAGALLGYICDRALRKPTRARARMVAAFRGIRAVALQGLWLIWRRARRLAASLPLVRARLASPALMLALLLASAGRGHAELELSVYGGAQSAVDSTVSGTDPAFGAYAFRTGWQGRSFEAPPQYGVRVVWWRDEHWGFGIDFDHLKVYADPRTRSANGFSVLEFTDGLNIVTANALYRWRPTGRLQVQPYVGVGAGVAVPHVEATTPTSRTFEYQLTGPAVAWFAGLRVPLNDRWLVFGEYKGTRSWNRADLNGGGTLNTNITTHGLNLGLTFCF